MFRTGSFAVLGIALGLAAAPAMAAPQLRGGGDDMKIVYGAEPGHTVVGGAIAEVHGGGDDATYVAAPGGQAREARLGRMEGGQQDRRVTYLDGRPSSWANTPADTDDLGHRG